MPTMTIRMDTVYVSHFRTVKAAFLTKKVALLLLVITEFSPTSLAQRAQDSWLPRTKTYGAAANSGSAGLKGIFRRLHAATGVGNDDDALDVGAQGAQRRAGFAGAVSALRPSSLTGPNIEDGGFVIGLGSI